MRSDGERTDREPSAGGEAVACHDSVATREGANASVVTALATFGTVDVVVNDARSMRNGMFEYQTPEMLDAMIAVTGEAFEVGCGHFARVFVGVGAGWTAPDPSVVTAEDVAERL